MSNLIGFGKNDKKIMTGGDLENYKGEKNRTDRIALCWFAKDPSTGKVAMGKDDTPQFIAEEIHYIAGKGYIRDNEYLRQKMGPPKRRIGTFVVHYRTDKKGNLQKPFEYEIKPWVFGEAKYRNLAEIHENFPLTTHDIKVVCEDDQFQKMTFYPYPDEAVWQMKESLRNEILEQVDALAHKLTLGRDVPIDELKDHFGDLTSPVPDVSASVDMDDLMDGIE